MTEELKLERYVVLHICDI